MHGQGAVDARQRTPHDHSGAEDGNLQLLHCAILEKGRRIPAGLSDDRFFADQFLPQVSAMSGVHLTKPVSI